MKPSAKKGFTIVDLVATMVVLTFAALILAVCMGTAWKLRAQAASWQASGAQLNSITAQKLGSPAKLTLTSGSSSLTAGPGSHGGAGGYYRSLDGLASAWVYYPDTMDWSALNGSGLAPQPAPASAQGDPLELAVPTAPAGLADLSFSVSGGTEGEGYGPVLGAGSIQVDRHVSVVLRQEFLYLAGGGGGKGDISSVYKAGGSPGSLTAAPASANGQPLLVYVAAELHVNRIQEGEGVLSWAWQPGWYAVPAGTDLFSADLSADTARTWRLDYQGIAREGGNPPSGNGDLTADERSALVQRLDEAYARLVLAGVTFQP